MRVSRRKMLVGALFGSLGLANRQIWARKALATAKLKRINLVFHGLFTFVITDAGIQALTPPNSDHTFCYLGRGGYIPMGDQYSLKGVKKDTPTKPAPDTRANAVLVASDCGFTTDKVDQGKTRAFAVYLPLPNKKTDMAPLRGIPVAAIDVTGTHKPKDYKPGDPISYPMVQVISYDVDPAHAAGVILESNSPGSFPSWQPYLGSGAEIENLHIFAEPNKPVPDDHAAAAFIGMAKMIHPNVADLSITRHPPASAPTPDPNPGIDGIASEEENSLQERNGTLTGRLPQAGVQIVNCMSLIVV